MKVQAALEPEIRALRWLGGLSPLVQISLGAVLIATVGLLDFLTGTEIGFSLFYVMPIAMLAWLQGRRWGVAASLLSALAWFWADRAAGQTPANDLVPVWNALIRLSFFVIITVLLSSLHRSMRREVELARIDSLTGALNSRAFYELVNAEISRLERKSEPFTLVYVDLDNFKPVNDQFGHSVGDDALCCVVEFARANLRRADLISRLGGDEFALLLPTTSADSATRVLSKLREGWLGEMERNGWPITFSMGALTCTAPVDVDELIKRADNLMYRVKRSGKNAIEYATL